MASTRLFSREEDREDFTRSHASFNFLLQKSLSMKTTSNSSSDDNEWSRPPLASCQILTGIGVYLIFAFLAGIILNALVLHALFECRHFQSPIRIYMIALTFVDLAEAVLGMPLPLTSNLACR